jgi:membrane protein required for colicin V production
MSGFDLFVLIAAGVFLISGVWHGLIRQALSLAGVLVGSLIAIRHFETAAKYLPLPPGLGRVVAFSAIIILSLLAAWLLGYLISKLMFLAGLGWADRLAGGLLGLLKAGVLASAVALFLVAALPSNSKTLRQSATLPWVLRFANLASSFVPPDLREQFQKKLRDLLDRRSHPFRSA